jgi:hypothetical protein
VHVVQRTNNKGGRWCSYGKSCVPVKNRSDSLVEKKITKIVYK